MVHPRITTSNKNSFNTTIDSHISIRLGTIDEDQRHGRLSREFEDDEASSRCKFFTTPGKNIDANLKDSRINHTKTKMTSCLVHRMLHRRAFGK
jgi:hypothetical protein